MRVLVACEFSSVVRDAFRARGHDAVSCDLLPTERPGPHIQGDVLPHLGDGWDLMIAHPPCTYLTCAGNKWFKPEFRSRFPGRERKRGEAMDFVRLLLAAPIPRVALENPVGAISGSIRKPDQIIQPWQFGHPVRKSTCLWLKGLPSLIPTEVVKPIIVTTRGGNTQSVWHVKTGQMPPEQRKRERSRTFPGIAAAMAEQWGNLE